MPRDPAALLPLKPETFYILLSLAEEPRHGYGIIKAVHTSTGGAVRLEPSPLYRRLKRLLELEMITQTSRPQDDDSSDERRLYYELTRFGQSVLREEAARIVAVAANQHVRDLAAGLAEGT